MISPEFLHCLAIALSIGLGAIGAALGQGLGGFSALESMSRQEMGRTQTFRTMIIGLAFIESGVILALVVTLIMLFSNISKISMGVAIAEIGIALMMGIVATSISIASSLAVKSSLYSISRQPIFANKILTLMLVLQSLMEAPIVFSLIMAFVLIAKFKPDLSILYGFKFFASALTMTLGSIGPCIGQGIFAKESCKAVGLNKTAYSKIFTFSVINGAVIETSLIFSLLVSLLIIFLPISTVDPILSVVIFVVAAFTMGTGSIGPGSATGHVGSKSVYQVAINPENYSTLFRSNILAQAFIESGAIYSLVVALILLINLAK